MGQATQGVKEGATRIGDATGARDAVTNATGGRSPDEMIAQVKDLIANNQLGAGAVLGGLVGWLIAQALYKTGVVSNATKIARPPEGLRFPSASGRSMSSMEFQLPRSPQPKSPGTTTRSCAFSMMP